MGYFDISGALAAAVPPVLPQPASRRTRAALTAAAPAIILVSFIKHLLYFIRNISLSPNFTLVKKSYAQNAVSSARLEKNNFFVA
jgi:hypothetical protein